MQNIQNETPNNDSDYECLEYIVVQEKDEDFGTIILTGKRENMRKVRKLKKIPALLFSENEVNSLLEIIDNIQNKDTCRILKK